MGRLSEDEFEATFTPPMTDVTTSVVAMVDVWPYIERVLASEYEAFETDSWDVEYVYINRPESHLHLLINTGMENVYLVVVVDILEKEIYGHDLLNLNQKYGLGH
ncbi:hypothetical protein [Salinisphaera sp. Q1T1-3]|uniref:hypothetical protein n=1 Tax=Salinisphaera sp. Q1T1-3 TaxID=2321229 RepID=UPI000E73BF8F|nr:hypothetical protein [Salinisphaera sp. Q1T1-3]RJS94159.1 hypothetical protein D3260_06255 [Salinisphaera sp. Q1T1-3]